METVLVDGCALQVSQKMPYIAVACCVLLVLQGLSDVKSCVCRPFLLYLFHYGKLCVLLVSVALSVIFPCCRLWAVVGFAAIRSLFFKGFYGLVSQGDLNVRSFGSGLKVAVRLGPVEKTLATLSTPKKRRSSVFAMKVRNHSAQPKCM